MPCPRCGGVTSQSDIFCPTCMASLVGEPGPASPTIPSIPRPVLPGAAPVTASAITVTAQRVDLSGHGAARVSPPPLVPPIVPPTAQAGNASGVESSVATSQPPPPSPGFAKDVTRYLCAAVQLDSGFNAEVIRALIHEKYRAIAHSPGVDLATVLKYALAARPRKLTTDALLLFELMVTMILLVSVGPLALFVGVFALWLTVHIELLITHHQVLQPHLRRANYDPKNAPKPSSPAHQSSIEEIATAGRVGNVTVSSGYSPFSGFGAVDMDYSAVVDLAKSSTDSPPRSFTVQELVERIEKDMHALGLPGVSVASRVLIDGRDLGQHLEDEEIRTLLPDPLRPPVTHVDDVFIRTLRETQNGRARPYLAIRVTGWSGEVVGTLFVRLQLLSGGDLLLVGLSRAVLAPLRERYHQADRNDSALRIAWTSVAKTPGDALGAGPRLFGGAMRAALRPLTRSLEAGAIGAGAFDYGPRCVPRERAALRVLRIPGLRSALPAPGIPERGYHQYFQEADRELYVKAVERRLFSVLATFLAEHGIASAELDARLNAVQNLDLLTDGGKLAAAGFGG